MKIKVSDLSLLTQRLLSHLTDLGIETIEISWDYYWHIPKAEIYDPYKKPLKLDLGQLSDDWLDLQKIVSGDRDAVITDFIDLSAILRAIGEEGYSFLNKENQS